MHIPSIASTWNGELSSRLDQAINDKCKPLGSLGQLERLARQIGLIQQTTEIELNQTTILVFAADHGVVAEGVSAYPPSATWHMVENFLAGGAAINVFARQNTCRLEMIDAGVNHDFGKRAGLIDLKVAPGTRNFAHEPAMSTAECNCALERGMALVKDLDCGSIGFGDMGIGSTTAAAAIMHKLTQIPVAECVGAGAGLSNDGIRHKQQVIEEAVEHHPDVCEPLDILATFGGFEIAMIAGAMLQAAQRRMVLLIDGFIPSSALLVAARLQPAILDYCVFAHCSDENGHARMLKSLEARPLLRLGLRLGEGTGCALALPLLNAAVNFLRQMAPSDSMEISTPCV